MLINVMRKVYEPQLVLANKLLPVGVSLFNLASQTVAPTVAAQCHYPLVSETKG